MKDYVRQHLSTGNTIMLSNFLTKVSSTSDVTALRGRGGGFCVDISKMNKHCVTSFMDDS